MLFLRLQIALIVTILSSASYAMYGAQKTNIHYKAVGSLKAFDLHKSHCSATLIAADWIMTADHCRYGGSDENGFIYKAEEIEFQIGEDSTRPLQTVKLKHWIHPGSVNVEINGISEELSIDVIFAKLEVPIKNVKPIPLLINPNFMNKNGSRYEIVGFGITNNKKLSSMRQRGRYQVTTTSGNAFINIFGNAEIFKKYLSIAHPGEEEIFDRHLYTAHLAEGYEVHAWDPRRRTKKSKSGWVNSCYGDSGGPLIKIVQNKFYSVGVISSGFRGETDSCVSIGSKISIIGQQTKETILENKIPYKN